MTTRPTVSVVICCYTEQRWFDVCAAVESITAQLTERDELIVAADHAPALAQRLREQFPAVTIVENSGARGLSGARNTGIAAARCQIVAFLDDDAVAEPDWLDELCRPYALDEVVGVGGRVVPRWDDARPSWFPPEFDWVVGCTYAGHPDEGPVRNMIGAAMSLRRSVFDQVGGFHDDVGRVGGTPTGCEETELCIRVTQRVPGAIIYYAPSAMVHHRVGRERATFAYFRARCLAEGASKQRVSRMVGAGAGLASERAYTTRTLPSAALRDLALAARERRGDAVARVGVRAAGVALAASGLVRTKARERRTMVHAVAQTRTVREFRPAHVGQVERDAPADVPGGRALDGRPYERAVLLVRDGGRPIGTVEVPMTPDGVDARSLAPHLQLVASPHLNPTDDERAPVPSALAYVTVVVATRDRPVELRRCVQSILASDYPRFDILIVDNSPTPGSAEQIAALTTSPEHAVRSVWEPTAGLARAHNRALPIVTSPIVAFTDDDVVVDTQWLRRLVDGFAVAPHVACVTGMIFPLELETPTQGLVEQVIGFNKGYERRVYSADRGNRDDPLFPFTAGQFGSGANMAFCTDELRAIGAFDDALGAGTKARGGDDLAAFFDVIVHGHVLVYEPAAIVFHAHHRDAVALHRQAYGYGAGLTAYLTKTLLDRPSRAAALAARVPAGLRYALAGDSPKNERAPDDWPRGLVWRERAGMLAGPALYLASRRKMRRAGVRRASVTATPVRVASAPNHRTASS
jgi:GT2 family glycosyltransferase